MTGDEEEKTLATTDKEVRRSVEGEIKLADIDGLELLRRIQDVFETRADPVDDNWVELFYEDRFGLLQVMRLWMRPQGHHVSNARH